MSSVYKTKANPGANPRKGCRRIKCHQVSVYLVTTLRYGKLYRNAERSKDGYFHHTYERENDTQIVYMGTSEKENLGWFSCFEEAEENLTTQGTVMSSRSSSRGPILAVIERVKQGPYAYGEEWWYAFDNKKAIFVRTEKPKGLRQIISFWR